MRRAQIFALAAAALYAISIPVSAVLLSHLDPYTISAFLYLGAGAGMMVVRAVSGGSRARPRVSAPDLPFLVAMVVLDIAAPLLLLFGLQRSHPANASLLNNAEIVATAMIALVVFGEAISRRLWIAIGLILAASAALSFDAGSLSFSTGSILVLAAAACWGLENNCTRRLSHYSSTNLVIVKGFGSGLGALLVGLAATGSITVSPMVIPVALLGFVSYGLSITLYIAAQRDLGAAKTSAFYAVSPFIGVVLSLVIFRQAPEAGLWIGMILMVGATYFLVTDTVGVQHSHSHTHTAILEHSHGAMRHTHEVEVLHSHLHAHAPGRDDEHDHEHVIRESDIVAHSHD